MTGIFEQLAWLTKKVKQLCCRLGILEQTVAECCEGGGGGGGTNPTDNYLPYNNAGTFADSYLVNDTDLLKTVYGSSDLGLKLDFGGNLYVLGDQYGYYTPNVDTNIYASNSPGGEQVGINCGGRLIFLSDEPAKTHFVGPEGEGYIEFKGGEYIRTYDGSAANGLLINYVGGLTSFTDITLGEFNVVGNGTNLKIDDVNQIIKTSYGGNDLGLQLDFGTSYYFLGDQSIPTNTTYISIIPSQQRSNIHSVDGIQLGDVDDQQNKLVFAVRDTQQLIQGEVNNIVEGFQFDFGNQAYTIGGFNSLTLTKLIVDDINSIIKTQYSGNDIGLTLDFANSQYKLGDARGFYTDGANTKIGDYDLAGQGTKLTVDDSNVVIELRSELPSTWENISSTVVSQVKTAYGANNLDLTTSGYTVYVPGVYTVRFASIINVIDLPNPTIYIGQTIVLVNKDNSDNQEIGANKPYDNLLGTFNPTLSAAVTWTLHSDGQDWNITSVY